MAFVGAFLLSAQKFGEIERDESDQRVAVDGGSLLRRHDGNVDDGQRGPVKPPTRAPIVV